MKSKSKELIDYSIVIPVYQNKGSIEETFEILKNNVIERNPQYSAEIIFVDDGSSDGSLQALIKLYKNYPELIVLIIINFPPLDFTSCILDNILSYPLLVTIATTGILESIKAIGPCFISAAGYPSAWIYDISFNFKAPSRATGN